MKALGALSSVTIALLIMSTIFFVASEVAQLAIRAQTQSLIAVTICLSVAFLIFSIITSRLSSSLNKE
jgi:hypothetical protein